MPKIAYQAASFQRKSLALIERANEIIEEYTAQGFDLTLRQLYYQFVARDIIPNTPKSYKNLGSLINDARLAGLIDWFAIVDRTRELRGLPHWETPEQIISECSTQFNLDLWKDQPYRPEIWIEKDALAGVFASVCRELDVPVFSCRGYTSQSEMWIAAMRMKKYMRGQQRPVVFHFGDHDPSGLDMSRDIQDRLRLFIGHSIRFERLALNMDQIEKYNPPPNPAKLTDSRIEAYVNEFGDESWELDALEPAVLVALVREAIAGIMDADAMQAQTEAQDGHRATLGRISDNFEAVQELVDRLEEE